MTVEQDHISRQIQNEFKRDILVQLLNEKTTSKKRRDLVSSARSSLSSHVSRQLLLEEHKLDIRLEQIEKERRQFLNNNSNEKHMLRLSLGLQSAKDWNSSELSKTKRPPIPRRHSEGNQRLGNPGSPVINRVNLQSAKKYLKQSKKRETLHKLKESLSWECDYILPQVPPPSRNSSRSPSSVNISVHNHSKNSSKQLVRRSSERKNNTEGTINRAKCVAKNSIVNENDCLNNQRISSPSPGFILNIMDNNITDESQIDQQASPNSSKLLATLLTNRTTSPSLLPSVTKLNISKNIYQFRQRRSVNSRICKEEKSEEKTCDHFGSELENMQSNIACRNDDGDNRIVVEDDRSDIGGDKIGINVSRQEPVEQPNEATSARDEIGSGRPRRQNAPNDGVKNSTSMGKQNDDDCLPCQKNESDNYICKKENGIIKVRRHNVKRYDKNKITAKKGFRKNDFQENFTNNSSKKQREKMFVSQSGKTFSVGDDAGIFVTKGDTNVQFVAKDGNIANNDAIFNDVTAEQNDLGNNISSSCGKKMEYKLRLTSPSPLSLPSPIQMKDFEDRRQRRKRERELIKMRRTRNHFQKSFQLQTNFPNDDSH